MIAFRNHSFNRELNVLASILLVLGVAVVSVYAVTLPAIQDTSASLTPRQREIEKQRQRLSSADVEERRDAIMRLGVMRDPQASRAALPGLSDELPIIRAAAAKAIIYLPASEAVSALVPLLSDRDEFVRQEAAYALGMTRDKAAVSALSELLATDKNDGVRAASVIALGEIADESAVVPLVQVISGQPVSGSANSKSKAKKEKNEFVVRAAVTALGRIGNRAAVPALVRVLSDENTVSDVKREAARALGLIADPSAVPALQAAMSAGDPYLSHTAAEALARISRSSRARG
jgi:HEAT repeats/PBS lyase HEAT-like repeat